MLAQHLVGLYYETPNVVEPPLDHSLLRDYIAYARENIHPELSDLASRELIAAYIEMRRGGSGGSNSGRGRTITATPRQLESLIRLSESLARMRYSRVVTRDNVQEAVRLMKVATQAAPTDPRTGRIVSCSYTDLYKCMCTCYLSHTLKLLQKYEQYRIWTCELLLC